MSIRVVNQATKKPAILMRGRGLLTAAKNRQKTYRRSFFIN